MDGPIERFAVTLDVAIRPCRAADLPALEWFGVFAGDRALIAEVFAQQARGDALMLVAEVNGEASGQAWGELARGRAAGIAELWAVRVLPCLQGRGIGARLVAAAEGMAAAQGFATMALAVESDNLRARAFYERLGYRVEGTRRVTHRTGTPPAQSTQWVLSKALAAQRVPAR